MAGELKTIYNNQLIRTSTADDTFTLNCNGKVMASDVTIQATDVDSLTVTYGGNTIATGSGTVTKILNCDGYVATSDIGVAVTMSSAPSYPVKGDKIRMDLDGTARDYLVLKINGSVAEVHGLFNVASIAFSSGSNVYSGSALDTTLNTTWYNTLSATAQNAIVDKTFEQDKWVIDNGGNPVYKALWGGGSGTPYTIGLTNASYGAQITRHIYALSVQDIIDYLEATPDMDYTNTTIRASNLNNVFISFVGLLLRSANSRGDTYVTHLASGTRINYMSASTNTDRARPAFQIDLDQISWSKV